MTDDNHGFQFALPTYDPTKVCTEPYILGYTILEGHRDSGGTKQEALTLCDTMSEDMRNGKYDWLISTTPVPAGDVKAILGDYPGAVAAAIRRLLSQA